MNLLRLALRRLIKNPGFSVIIVLTLALGIGATTAIFSLVYTTLLRPLPYPEADRLVHVTEANDQWNDMSVSFPNFEDWRAGQDVFSALAIYHPNAVKIKTAGGIERVSSLQVSADFFAAVGVHAAMGRDLGANDDRPGAAAAVWLSHRAWERFFSTDERLVGRSILVDGTPTAVAGILPGGFRFHRAVDLIVAIGPYVDRQFMRERANHNDTAVIGRLRPGITLEAAAAQMAAIGVRLEHDYPKANTGIHVRVIPLRQRIAGSSQLSLVLLFGAVGMVMLIACSNVANMLLARSFGRAREMAIRTALGATRPDLIRQLLTESLVLAVAGGVVGAVVGSWGADFVGRLIPWEMRPLVEGASGVDRSVMLAIAGLTLFSGLAFGLAPAWQLSHANPNDALKNAKPTLHLFFGRLRLSDALVVAQIGLALMLLVGAGLMIRSLYRLSQVDSGLRPERVLTLRVAAPPLDKYAKDPAAYVAYHEQILDRVAALPDVESAAFASSLPFSWDTSNCVFFRADRPLPAPGKFPVSNSHVVTPDYFHVMGIPLLRGSLFDGHEPVPRMPEGAVFELSVLPAMYRNINISCVISQRMADLNWPGEDPIGKLFQMGFPDMHLPSFKVIGIVGNTTQEGLENGAQAEFYSTLRQFPAPMGLYLVVRSQADPAGLVSSARTAVHAVAPDEPIYDVTLMSARIALFSADRRFNMGLFTFFAATALLLSVLGIYGVLSCVVGQRMRDIGIRLALGAQREEIVRGVLLRGLALAGPGVGLGLAGAWAGGRLLESQLFGITGADALAYGAAAGLLLLAALLACALPARRATRVNPIEVLRAE